MTRRAIAGAVLAVAAGALTLPATPAVACDPNRFPNCQTYCGWVAWRYGELRELAGEQTSPGVPLPPWPRTGVAGCP